MLTQVYRLNLCGHLSNELAMVYVNEKNQMGLYRKFVYNGAA